MRIHATGAYLPARCRDNRELEEAAGLAPGTMQVLGVRSRHEAAPDEALSDLAVAAASNALAGTKLRPDLLILATSTPDHPVPATAPFVAHRLGLQCGAFDLMNACSGFLYGLHLAARGGTTLVIGANVLSRRLDRGDWATSGLFGDGAGAVVVGPGEGILSTVVASDGAGTDGIRIEAGGSRRPITAQALAEGRHLLRMPRHKGAAQDAAKALATTARQALEQAGLDVGDIDRFVPHQASAALIDEACRELGIPADRTSRWIAKMGNTSAASIPLALHADVEAGHVGAGDRILLAAVAAGRTTAAAVVEWT